MDKREDAGDFYPGGKVISTRPVATGGDVKHSEFAGLDVKTNTIPDLRDAVRELGRRLGATVVTALAACVAVAATVQIVPVNDLDFDANPSVVTNVVFDAPPDFSTNNTALVETIEATAPAPGDYAAVSNAAVYAAITNALQDVAIESNRVNIASNRVAISTLSDTKLDKSGGTMTGSLTLPGISLTNGTILYGLSVFELISYRGGTLAIMEQIAPEFSAASSYEVGQLVIQYSRLRKCSTAGTGNAAVFADATVEDVLAELRAGKADKTDIDAAISPTSPAFSNAVLSVGLGIDTNTVAVINELVDSAHDLPVTGATSVGALLLALAAAVAALKKNLRYSYNTATVSSGTTPTVTDVADRAINSATLGSSVTAATVTLPAATADRARDFFIDLTIEATTAPTLTFIDPATSTTANVAFGADSLADIDTGKNAILFTEFPNYTWIVSVKHEEVTA